jgi:hypothetical protein
MRSNTVIKRQACIQLSDRLIEILIHMLKANACSETTKPTQLYNSGSNNMTIQLKTKVISR